LQTVFRHLDQAAFATQLGGWAESLPATTQTVQPEAEAIDGKSLRGSQKQGAPGAHLLSALSHRLGLRLGQPAVPDQTNAISAVTELLTGLIIKGRVITMDALLTQRKMAEAIIARQGDYVMIVKDNQAKLRKWISAILAEPLWRREASAKAETLDLGHGRIERRQLQASRALADRELWPGLAQVFIMERPITQAATGKTSQEGVYGCTS
jgi:hypothetical protein